MDIFIKCNELSIRFLIPPFQGEDFLLRMFDLVRDSLGKELIPNNVILASEPNQEYLTPE